VNTQIIYNKTITSEDRCGGTGVYLRCDTSKRILPATHLPTSIDCTIFHSA